MKGKNIKNPQLNVFRVPLVSIVNMKHELVLLAQIIGWEKVEVKAALYKNSKTINDRPAVQGTPKKKEKGECSSPET